MIARITGRLVDCGEQSALIETASGLTYEVLTPPYARPPLIERQGREVTLFTVHFLEGSPGGGNLTPRLIGFPAPVDREFFGEYTRVKGIGMRKALRSLAISPGQLAAVIEAGDVRTLATLPEIGKRTADAIVSELRGKLASFAAEIGRVASAPIATLNAAQRTAMEILVQWGDRRADAERWVAAAVETDPALNEPDAIVKAAYRLKARV